MMVVIDAILEPFLLVFVVLALVQVLLVTAATLLVVAAGVAVYDWFRR